MSLKFMEKSDLTLEQQSELVVEIFQGSLNTLKDHGLDGARQLAEVQPALRHCGLHEVRNGSDLHGAFECSPAQHRLHLVGIQGHGLSLRARTPQKLQVLFGMPSVTKKTL